MNLENIHGIDASIETSLSEYALLVATNEQCEKDEYFVYYRINNGNYDYGYKTESELNALINGKDWMNKEDIASFLSFVNSTKEIWLSTPFVNKLYDLMCYYGYANIMGESYTEGVSFEEIMQRVHESQSN